jgi:hypothetical protein
VLADYPRGRNLAESALGSIKLPYNFSQSSSHPKEETQVIVFCWSSLGLGCEEARHRSLSSRRLSQQGTSSCLGHLATLARLMFLRGNFFGLSSSHLDSFFNFFDEAQQSGIMFRLPLRVNQLLTVSELNSLARIIKPAHSCNSL